MKLSELVNYYNRLCELTAITAKQSSDTDLQQIVSLSQDAELASLQVDILNKFDAFESALDRYKKEIHGQIREQERPYIQKSYILYEQVREHKYEWFHGDPPKNLPFKLLADQKRIREENLKQHVDNILNSRLAITESGTDFILARIKRYTSWQNTTMILHPGVESWIDDMVGNDPVYLVDETYELLQPALEKFNPIYQNRLRKYVIHEDQNKEILWQLPDDQFGIVLAWNYFNHRPFEVIKTYMTEIYKKLKPGGSLLMSYNDCDRWKGVLAVETQSALYTPGFLIKGFAENLGFEETIVWHENGSWTWIELKKPGNRQSLRGSQPMAKILPKPVA